MTGNRLLRKLNVLYGMSNSQIVFISKYKRKNDSDNQRIAGKTKPYAVPVFGMIGKSEELIDQDATCKTAKQRAKPVNHHHKQPLRATPYLGRGLCFNK